MIANNTQYSLAPFDKEAHLNQTISCIMKVRTKDPSYPPRIDVPDFATSIFRKWLMEEDAAYRWVALSNDVVVGHISLVEAHRYLTEHLTGHGEKPNTEKGYLEIGKFFTNPDFQGHGIGTKLLRHAISTSLREGFTPALAVISTSTKAIEVYKKENMKPVGYFDGIHGKNLVFVGAKT